MLHILKTCYSLLIECGNNPGGEGTQSLLHNFGNFGQEKKNVDPIKEILMKSRFSDFYGNIFIPVAVPACQVLSPISPLPKNKLLLVDIIFNFYL